MATPRQPLFAREACTNLPVTPPSRVVKVRDWMPQFWTNQCVDCLLSLSNVLNSPAQLSFCF